MANNFLAFCPVDIGTNLLSQSDYAAAADRTNGNQPGVASSKLNNKAIRQAAYIASQVAQLTADVTGADVLDDAVPARLLAQLNAAMKAFPPQISSYLSGSGNHNITYIFCIAVGSATAAATYTNNGVTYTVKGTIASGFFLKASGNGAPTVSGTLTKTGGTGDSSLVFYAVRTPILLEVEMVAGGGGGGAAGTTGTAGAASGGGTTSFGTTLLSCTGGNAGANGFTNAYGGAGGAASLGTGPAGIASSGSAGGGAMITGATFTSNFPGGAGGSSAVGGGGSTGYAVAGLAAGTNSGSGGGGGGCSAVTVNNATGGGGGAGAYVKAWITSILSTYAYIVGAAGTGGTLGTGGTAGGNGGAGFILVTESYQ